MNYSKNIFVLSAALALAAGATIADTVDITAETETTTGYSGTAQNPLTINFKGGKIKNKTAWNGRLIGDYVTLQGINGNLIELTVGEWRPFKIGGVATATAGNSSFKLSGPAETGGNENYCLAILTNSVTWGHTGNLIIDNVMLRIEGMAADMANCLPYGPGHGGVKISTQSWTFGRYGVVGKLNINGRSQCINWLEAQSNGMVTNSNPTAASLTFGSGNVASYVKGPIGGKINVRKVGSGAFTLHDSSMPNLTVQEGSVSVSGTSTMNAMTNRPGISVSITDGGTLAVAKSLVSAPNPVTDESAYFFGRDGTGSISNVLDLADASIPASISIANGGTLEVGGATDAKLERITITSAGTLRKVGTGALMIDGSEAQTLGGTIHVAAGSLAFAGIGNTNEWWKFVVTRVGNAQGKLRLGQFGLFDKDGNKLWTSLGVTENASVATLANGRATYTTPAGWSYESDNTVSKIFTGNWYDYLQVIGMATQYDQSACPFEVALRLPAGANPAAYFSFSTYDGFGPSAFHVESSPTGADGTWTIVGSGTWTPVWDRYYYWLGDGTWGGICGMPWRIAPNTTANVNVSGATLRVDSGATLDLAGANGAVAAIEVDWTSLGGTIRGLAIPANGTLALVNVPSGTNLYGPVLLTLDAASGSANFSSWTVTVNGRAKDCRIQLDANGALTLGAEATVITLR